MGLSHDGSLAVARRQSARLWELRAAARLARFWADQGDRPRAEDLLAPICSQFAECLELPNLDDARSLLASLT